MNAAATLGTVLLAYVPAAMIPGPNFVLIAHTAAAGSRRAGVTVALGVVVSGGLLATIGVFGIGTLLAHAPAAAAVLRVICGLYLAWLGIRLCRRARTPSPETHEQAPAGFRQGVVSNLTNPKAAAFFGSVLTATVPPTEPLAVRIAAVLLIVVASTAWHLTVALLFSAPAAQRWYDHAKPTLNRVVGVILIALGLALALTP